MLCYEQGLIEAALAQAFRVEGNRNNGLRSIITYFSMQALKKQLRQGLSQVKTPRIFELMDCML